MNESNYLEQVTEQIRLSYAHLLEMYIQLCNKYNNIRSKIRDEEVKRYLHLTDRYFYNKTGKFDWDNIYPLLPPNIEKSIKKEHGILAENEIRLCCLLLFDVKSDDIANILPYTQNSVYSITHRIKEKTGIKDIKTCLKKLLLVE